MNPLAQELNQIIQRANPHVLDMLSRVGKNLFFPKGILSQGAEAKEKAYRFNATIGMATEKGRTMHLPSVMNCICDFQPEDALTYAPSFGVPELRLAWKEAILRKNPSLAGRPLSLPVVTCAITHGLSVTADMWIDPGDVIVLPDKMWGNYNLIFGVRKGARIVTYPLFGDRGGFNVEGFRACVMEQAGSADKVVAILNFPNNPTGYTPTPAEADAVADVLIDAADKGVSVVAVTDDSYFGLFYNDDILKESIFTRLAGRHSRLMAVKLDGATKEDYVWGLRVGFVTYGVPVEGDAGPFYEALERKTAGAVRGSVSNASRLSQAVLLEAMGSAGYAAEKEEKVRIMRSRAEEVNRVLQDPRYQGAWEPYPFNSGYFMCLRLKTVDAEALRVHLLDRYGIGLISLGRHDLRVAFSCIEKEDVRELFNTVLQGVKDLEP
ncbi:MAG: aminotransferase class I/II-fold pyridoxal phosphate-dependent enzyme [Thermodesulfobacteriota bacterium]